MGLFTRPKIDPALEVQLRKRGMLAQLEALKQGQPYSGLGQFRREIIPSALKVGNQLAEVTGGKKLAQGLAGAIAAPEINRIEQQNLKSKTDLLDSIRREAKKGKLTPERRARLLKMAEQIDPQVAKEIPELQLSNKEILASAGQLALTATLGAKPSWGTLGTGKLVSGATTKSMGAIKGAMTAVKEAQRVRTLGPTLGKLANYGIKTAKQVATDASLGAGIFGLQAYGEGKSGKDIAKQAAIGAGAMATLPIVAGGVLRGAGALTKLGYKGVVKPVAGMIIKGLEKVATGAGKAERIAQAGSETAKTLAVIPGRFQNLKQNVAKGILNADEAFSKLPAKMIDRFSSLRQFGFETYRNARLTRSTAEGKAEVALQDLFGSKSKPGSLTPFRDIEDQVKARIMKLDAISRSKLGQKVASEQTAQQLEEGLQKLIKESGKNEPRVQQAVKVWNDFTRKLLNERVAAGVISTASRDAMLAKYPNYMPHNVIKDLDEQVATAMGGGSSLSVPKTDIMKATGSTREIEDPFIALTQRTPNAYNVMEKNRTMVSLVQAQETGQGIVGMRPLETAAQVMERRKAFEEQTINLFRNGIKETWVVPKDVAVAVKNLDAERMGAVMKFLTAPTRTLKSLATRYNLSFTLPNKLRDKQTALLTADAFIEDMLTKTGGAGGKTGPIGLNNDQLYRLWKESGGAFGSIFQEVKGANFQSYGKLKKQGIWNNLIENIRPDKMVDNINQSIEESTRLEVFKKALERGLSSKDAALVARDATVDFAKMGTWMRNLNEIIPFLNARVQGAINVSRAANVAPETFARMQMWSSVLPTLGLYRWNKQFESSKNIPQYFYDQYWPIMVGETDGFDESGNAIKIPKFITIKKGEGQSLVANPIQWFLRNADGQDPRRVSDMIANTIGNFSPIDVGTGGYGVKNPFLAFISQFGPATNIAIGLATGTDPYSGQPIVPASRQGASPAMQFKKTTPETTKQLAGIMKVSPANLEFVINSFGGVPQDVQQLLNIGVGMVKGEGLRTNPLEESPFGQATKLPVLKRFFRESTDFGSSVQQQQAETKAELQQGITDKNLKIKDEAEKTLSEMYKFKTKEEKIKYLEQANPSDEVRKKMSQLKKSRQAVEVLTPQDSVELRAKYILQRLTEMNAGGVEKADRVQFLDELENNKILTPEVREMIAKLKTQL